MECDADVRPTAITPTWVPSPIRYTRRRWLVIRGGARCNWSSRDGFLIFTSAFTSASRACRAPVTTLSFSAPWDGGEARVRERAEFSQGRRFPGVAIHHRGAKSTLPEASSTSERRRGARLHERQPALDHVVAVRDLLSHQLFRARLELARQQLHELVLHVLRARTQGPS